MQPLKVSSKPLKPKIEFLSANSSVKNIILVLSGKGGCGKSSVSVSLSYALAHLGFNVGLMDLDFCGPSIPSMVGVEGQTIKSTSNGWMPVSTKNIPSVDSLEQSTTSNNNNTTAQGSSENMKSVQVMSLGLLVTDPDAPVIWRGPKKVGLLRQFFGSVYWKDIDYLIVDTPPGTSDEHLMLVRLLKDCPIFRGAILVSTPQDVAVADVMKSIDFCKRSGLQMIGLIENMSGFQCSGCGSVTEIFSRDGVQKMSKAKDVPIIGKIPLSPDLVLSMESGNSLEPNHPIFQKFVSIAKKL